MALAKQRVCAWAAEFMGSRGEPNVVGCKKKKKLWFTQENLLWGARLGKTWVHVGTGWHAKMQTVHGGNTSASTHLEVQVLQVFLQLEVGIISLQMNQRHKVRPGYGVTFTCESLTYVSQLWEQRTTAGWHIQGHRRSAKVQGSSVSWVCRTEL